MGPPEMNESLNSPVQAAMEPPAKHILDIDVAWLDWLGAYRCIEQALASDRQSVFAFLNAHNANLAVRNPAYRHALQHFTILPDGIGVDLAARALYGEPFPANLNGTDFVPALLTYLATPLRVALVGARADILQKATEHFQRQVPWHTFIAVSDGYFDKDDCDDVLAKLAAAKPDLVLVALGTPDQELWIEKNLGAQHGKVVMGVGALFDFASEMIPRAPKIIRLIRCEWIFRLVLEPRRMWRRYLLGNPLFLFHILRYRYWRRNTVGGSAQA